VQALELKIPPVLVTALFAVAMWVVAKFTPPYPLPEVFIVPAALAFVAASAVFGLGGVAAFRKAGTTVNPLDPGRSTHLVVRGVYRYSRNPMYVALLLLLFAWGIRLSNPYAMLTAWLFIPWMNRFQVIPEERAMLRLFGQDFVRYAQRVRRWI